MHIGYNKLKFTGEDVITTPYGLINMMKSSAAMASYSDNPDKETPGHQKTASMMYKLNPSQMHRPHLLPPIVCSRRLYIQISFLLILLLIFFLLRTLSNMRVVFVHFHMESDTDGELVILPEELAQQRGAFCLDGSPPGFYMRHGSVSAENSWIIHLQSGGWCTTLEDCYHRSYTSYGSSLACDTSAVLEGVLSSNKGTNPDFYTWNVAQLVYCDGGSFAGNRSDAPMYLGRKLYMRGAVILETLIDYLLRHTNLSTAQQVILVGSSAGGLGALIHADRLRQKLPRSVKTLHVLIDGALFLDQPDVKGHHTMAEILQNTFYLHNIKDCHSLSDCTKDRTPSDKWKCFLPGVYHRHVFIPALFFNSLYDTWYTENALRVWCVRSGSCTNGDLSVVDGMREAILAEGREIVASGKHGVFLTSCPVHTMLTVRTFTYIKAQELNPQKALALWIRDKTAGYNVTQVLPLKHSWNLCDAGLK
ncbi:pectin acetylesterase 5-like [Gigantopelta aegis]|uniref:pectin acetylesterase 5-like n=1 Tax=Gigantopelta aegis TaxID=1735272 RepID=UPI001B88C201|nr:pectin acetylesterase 5-like [Gigantopelta aegis]